MLKVSFGEYLKYYFEAANGLELHDLLLQKRQPLFKLNLYDFRKN